VQTVLTIYTIYNS